MQQPISKDPAFPSTVDLVYALDQKWADTDSHDEPHGSPRIKASDNSGRCLPQEQQVGKDVFLQPYNQNGFRDKAPSYEWQPLVGQGPTMVDDVSSATRAVRKFRHREASTSSSCSTHAYLVGRCIRSTSDAVSYLTYDAANGLVLILQGALLSAYDCNSFSTPLRLSWTVQLTLHKPVLALRCSTGCDWLAIQRTNTMMDFINLKTGHAFMHGTSKGNGSIRYFFFSYCPQADFVTVTNKGLELHYYTKQGLLCGSSIQLTNTWHTYSYETRILAVGAGLGSTQIHSWQFAEKGMVKLPVFQITPGLQRAVPGSQSTQPKVSGEQVRVLKLYNDIFVAHISQDQHKLFIYKMYSDAVILHQTYELLSSRVDLLVVDSMLLVYHFNNGTVLLIDANDKSPISQPLPMRLLSAEESEEILINVVRPTAEWRFAMPNVVIDVTNLQIYQAHVDLKNVAAACSDRTQMVSFLQRRHTPSLKLFHVQPKDLLIDLMRQAIKDQIPMPEIRSIFDEVNTAFAAAATTGVLPTGENCEFSGQGRSFMYAVSSAAKQHVLSPAEVGCELFQWAMDEGHAAPRYLEAAALEYLHSAESFAAAQPLFVHSLLVVLKLKQDHHYQVIQMLHQQPTAEMGFLSEQVGSRYLLSKEHSLLRLNTAARASIQELESASDQGPMEAYCRMLLNSGQVLRAARYACRKGLSFIRPGTFLDAAAKSGNICAFHSIYRMWNDILSLSFETLEAAKLHYNIVVAQELED